MDEMFVNVSSVAATVMQCETDETKSYGMSCVKIFSQKHLDQREKNKC